MTWKTIKLGEVVTHRKGSIIIENDHEYKLCRVQLHRKGVVLRSNTLGSDIKTKKQQVCKSGDFLVAEMDAKVGGYGFVPEELDGAIVSSHYFLFELNKEKILPEYLEMISQLLILQDQIKAVGSTNYAAIRPTNVLNWEIPICSIEKQASIVSKYINQRQQSEGLNSELTHQLTLVKQLRQSFLREAMQGKLTADFRNAHPELTEGENSAQALLEKIKAEKKQLIKDGKLKKEKELAPVGADEMPFDINENDYFIRLGEICNIEKGKIGIQQAIDGIYPLVVTGENRLSHNEAHFFGKGIIIPLVSSTGHGHASLKRIHFEEGEFAVGNILACVTTYLPQYFNLKFIYHYLDTYKEWYFVDKMKGAANVSLKISSIQETPIPIIPIEIQNKFEELMRTCDELEASIRSSQQQNEMLLREVLREALEG